MSSKYDDIIDLPHHVSATRPRMTPLERAAQFLPFAALTGYGEAVEETARLTNRRIELDESAKEALGERLRVIAEHISERPEARFTFFRPDPKKAGGAYHTVGGPVKKIEPIERTVILCDGSRVPIDEIIGLECELFGDGPAE